MARSSTQTGKRWTLEGRIQGQNACFGDQIAPGRRVTVLPVSEHEALLDENRKLQRDRDDLKAALMMERETVEAALKEWDRDEVHLRSVLDHVMHRLGATGTAYDLLAVSVALRQHDEFVRTLAFYADPDNWLARPTVASAAVNDEGERARAALSNEEAT